MAFKAELRGVPAWGRRRGRLAAAVCCAVVLGGALESAGSARAVSSATAVGVHRLFGDVYEYDYLVPTGIGPFHQVGVHRVVEVRGGAPISAPNGVFLVHGDAWDFNAAFRGGSSHRESIAVFLASKGIDVWGVDLGWTLVPAGTKDFSFMRGWGLQRDINDVETAMRFARAVRLRTGSTADKLALLTWSRGGWIGYSLLNEESQKPLAAREVRAFIPVDTYFKINNAAERSANCAFEEQANKLIAGGNYATGNDGTVRLGQLAEQAPQAPSPILGPPYTNLQASLEVGAAAFRFGTPDIPWYHYVAGVFPGGSTDSIPTGLVYTTVLRWNNFLRSASPVEPWTLIRDTEAISCAQTSTGPFDDHLRDVTVPVMYVGAGGGFGRSGLYSLSSLGSRSVSTHIVSFFPEDQKRFDFGHVDLFYARDAAQLVWTPIYDWLIAHPRGPPSP